MSRINKVLHMFLQPSRNISNTNGFTMILKLSEVSTCPRNDRFYKVFWKSCFPESAYVLKSCSRQWFSNDSEHLPDDSKNLKCSINNRFYKGFWNFRKDHEIVKMLVSQWFSHISEKSRILAHFG